MNNEEKAIESLIAMVNEFDKDQQLDPNGHYAFAVVGFVRPENPDEWVECETDTDRKATVASVVSTLGAGDIDYPPIEQMLAGAVKEIFTDFGPELIQAAQQKLREREEKLQ